MDTLVITLRVALSLGVVLALMWVLHRRVSKGQLGRTKAKGRRSAAVEVVARQGIGGKASVVVVDVEGERLVLGVTEHGVSLLTSGAAPAPELTIVTGPVVLPSVPRPVAPEPTAPAASADAFRAELDKQDQAAPSLPSDLPMRPRNRNRRAVAVPTSAQLQGSILSVDTWRQAAAAVRNRRAG
ncbi:flagellar biosynthetic protein FliO [Curtobacterium sp. PhB136]|uniref:FliO/MopB family protein n=1 Tax=Curtobacterium sp. PhB136 TaxID=2485181 RepID=UPI00104C12DB|nr:flagellar biosynthetic protein FliO [Curtobacterium sp. PhB136]TCK60165.1 flagellar biosynthetic protein FliO [Curtobacterium sp. PhB136]